MNLKNLNNHQLLKSTLMIVQKEKLLTLQVLEHLQEVENRKLYCEQALPSLFSYCTKILGYSEAEASVRVNAVRVITSVPEVKKDITSGQLSLTNLSAAQRFFNAAQIPGTQRKEILDQIKDKTAREAKKILDEKIPNKPRSLKINLNEKLLKKLKLIQKDMDDASELEALEVLMDGYLAQKNAEKPHRKSKIVSKNQRYITRKAKEAIHTRAHAQCEYVNPDTKQRCTARTHLQYDHVRPISIGGQSDLENLRILCSGHNQWMRIKREKN